MYNIKLRLNLCLLTFVGLFGSIHGQSYEHKLGHISTDGDGTQNFANHKDLKIYDKYGKESLVLSPYILKVKDKQRPVYMHNKLFQLNRYGIDDLKLCIIDLVKRNNLGISESINEAHIICPNNFLNQEVFEEDIQFSTEEIDSLAPIKIHTMKPKVSVVVAKDGKTDNGNNYFSRTFHQQYVDVCYESCSRNPSYIYFHPIVTPKPYVIGEDNLHAFILVENFSVFTNTTGATKEIDYIIHAIYSDDSGLTSKKKP